MRIFYLEDNPLIAMHVEQLIEDAGHVFAGTASSFEELRERFDTLVMDCALVDIDLADGHTGPQAVVWLKERGVPSIFVTGQSQVAEEYRDVAVGVVPKPISESLLAEKLRLLASVVNNSD